MTAVATNRVIADFYHGINFPPDWARRPTQSIGLGLARDRIFSVVVLLDAKANPLAACWQAAGEAEKFVRIRFDDRIEDDLLDALDDDLADRSHHSTGQRDLFATMLWEPKSLQPGQGIDVHPPRYGPFFDPIAEERGWNVAPANSSPRPPTCCWSLARTRPVCHFRCPRTQRKCISNRAVVTA